MVEGDCDEVVLETEITNKSALKLYENLGFVRDKRLFRYYLNGVDALRLKLWLRWGTDSKERLHPHGSDFCMQCNLCRIALQVDLVIPMQLLSVSVHWVSHNICCTLAWRICSELNEIVLNFKSSVGTSRMCQLIAKTCSFAKSADSAIYIVIILSQNQ